eukprot:372037-Amphidinium_carterae.2
MRQTDCRWKSITTSKRSQSLGAALALTSTGSENEQESSRLYNRLVCSFVMCMETAGVGLHV